MLGGHRGHRIDVGLVADDPRCRCTLVGFHDRIAGIDHLEKQIRLCSTLPRAPDALLFDRVIGVAQPRSVDQYGGNAVKRNRHLDKIARRSGDGGDDGGGAHRQRIDKT